MLERVNAGRPFVLALLWLAGCVQSAFYHPDRVLYDSPARLGLTFEQVSFASKDGTRLVGWFVSAQGYADPKRAKQAVSSRTFRRPNPSRNSHSRR